MTILHVENSPKDAELVRELILHEWPESSLTCVASRERFLAALEQSSYDLILSDFALDSFNGIEALKLAKAHAPDTPFIFLSGTIGEDRALEALRSGAQDYVLKDGMKRLVSAIARAISESEERKKRRQAESRSRELSSFLNQAREAVVVTDLDGRITFWNQGAERLTGWTSTEAVEKTCDALFDAETMAGLRVAGKGVLTAGQWAGEIPLVNRAGKRRLIELRLSLVLDDAGHPRARLALATDITERRLAELRIKEQADMLNQAREGIMITDPANRVIYWNAGAERMFGWSGHEVLGRRLEQIFPVEVSASLRNARDATLLKGEWAGELRMQQRSGQTLIVESRQTLIRDDLGQPKAQLCINSDITDRKQLEAQFLRAQRMENIGMLAAGIAHDLNNMLAPILLAAPMLREHVSDAGGLSLLATLEKSAERGANLVRQILSFAHGTTGEKRLLQVKHVLRDVAAVIAGTFPKSIRLEDFIPSDLWPIEGNPTQIHQVVLNLCVNARDAMPDGGALRLRAENRTLELTEACAIGGARAGPFVVMHIEDTGTGIPPEVVARMWEPFFTTKDSEKGTGLGLSTVRGIVENHNGFVQFTTLPGRGTTFRIHLPAAEGPETDQQRPATTRASPPGRGELILIVDDEERIRDMTFAILTRNRYRVILAADGAEAAAIFAERASEIRLVITDLHMPNLDGATLGRALRKIKPEMRLLVMSGMSPPTGNRSEFKPEEFADSFLHKPFKPEVLLSRVHELLHGSSTGSGTPWRGPEPENKPQ